MPADSTYHQYRAELNGPKTAESARVGVLVVVGLNSGFIALDWWSQPEQFSALLAVRLFWDLVMGGVYWGLAKADPVRVMLVGLYLTGIGMLTVIGLAGGLTSSYWPGMMILFLGIPVMLPVSVGQAALVVSTLSVGFLGLPAFTGESPTLTEYLVPAFFVCGAAVECVASTAALERLRLRDFLQRKELEDARDHLREMDEVKTRFTANVHHELRTPLTLTLAPVEGLLAGEFGPLTDQQASYLQTVHSNALRLLNLINNLLDLAKIESNQLAVTRCPVNLGDIAQRMVQGAQPAASRKGISLTVEANARAPIINADPAALEKVLMNLIGNALKFSRSGGCVSVTACESDEGVLCRVADSGVGLAADQLDRVFDRFAQADTSATRRHEGTGIGLSLSKELVELHGGRIWAESVGAGEGATFSFWLPVGQPDVEDGDPLFSDDEQDASTGSGALAAGQVLHLEQVERDLARKSDSCDPNAIQTHDSDCASVLICEDNPDMRRLLRDLVGREFEVRVAKNGAEGLRAVQDAIPDLVLTDVMMPEMSGIELCAALKADPATAGVPVVLVTSKAERDMKIEGLEKGADDYVTKPFHARELLARVRSLVKLRRVSAEVERQNEALESANDDLARALRDLKEAEAQIVHSERLAAVGELAAGLAHEVNNPVNFALNAARTLISYVEDIGKALREYEAQTEGSTEAARDRGKEPLRELAADVLELAEIVSDGLERTSRLVGDLRDLAGPGGSERSRVDIRQTVESAVQLTRYFIQKRGAVVEVQAGDEVPAVRGDAQALGQVFLNLLKNAAETFECDGGRIWVEMSTEAGGALVKVVDNGPGIPPECNERVFDPFFTTKPAGKGSGLGLSISKKVIEEHSGRIETTSAAQGGASFSVWLPAESPSDYRGHRLSGLPSAVRRR